MRKFRFHLSKPQSGQALVEYTLIVVLVIIAFAVALAATGPAIGNVFSNTVCNLVQGQNCSTPIRSIPDINAFWGTVTWAARQTPQESPFPTNPPVPPPASATAGPSPTPSPTVPTRTPVPSNTPPPTNTPTDFRDVAPTWFERANPDTAVRWRLDNTMYLGSEEWVGDYYPNTNLSGSPDFRQANTALTPPSPFAINFNWPGSTGPRASWPASTPGENFSVRWFRRVYTQTNATLSFNLTADDGVRFYVLGPGLGGNVADPTSGPSCAGGSGTTPATGCRLVNDWTTHGPTNYSSRTVTLTGGNYYLLVLEYFDQSGGAEISLNMQPRGIVYNSNDTVPSDCNWGRTNSLSSSSQSFMWEEYVGGSIPANMTCTLEYRGRVYVPPAATLANPHFIFWSAWDFSNSATRGYVEFANYASRQADGTYPPGSWQRVNVFQGTSANYNWTRFAVNLSNVGGINFSDKEVAFRFVIENGNVSSGGRNWYIDDMTIQSFSPDATNFPIGSYYNLDQTSQAVNFIYTENWTLSNNYVHGTAGGTNMAFNDSAGPSGAPAGSGNTHNRFQNSDCPGGTCPAPTTSPGQPSTSRVYYIEFNGWVDLSGSIPDAEGDTGLPLLSFWHAYDIGGRVRLEVQYTRDPFISAAAANQSVRTTWTRVPGGPGMDGNIVPFDTNPRTQLTFTQRTVQLDQIPQYDTQRFRLRLAMIVDTNATLEDGWWIDDIYIERMSRPRYTPYPFFDDAEINDSAWLMEGSWARYIAPSVFNVGAWVYADSPIGGYLHNTNASMQLRWPIDLRNDTPANLNPPGATAAPTPGNQGGAAVRPVLSFWHHRDLGASDNFVVEWRRYRDTAGPWNTIWRYNYQDTTQNGLPTNTIQFSQRTASQRAWEQVVIHLDPVLQMVNTANAADLDDDDIIIRFRLEALNNTNVGDGLSIDNITIENYTETSWRLWGPSFDPDGGGPLTTGSGETYTDGVDNPSDWWNRWSTGGDWTAIDWNTMVGGGLRSFHDSPTGQTAAPFYFSGSNFYDGVAYDIDTFNILEMNQILDLRGVALDRRPFMSYWHRYWVASSDVLYVQVAVEDTTSPVNTAPCGGTVGNFADPPRQCYERTAGWGRWTTVDSIVGELRNYSWTRELVDLSGYVGRRIRVRFVTDALDGGTNRDGWYIDNVRFFYNNYTSPTPYQLSFYDPARNMDRWITEGSWGLDPRYYRGSGGGPADLGSSPWSGYWFACNSCSANAAATLLNGIPDTPAGYNTARTNAGAGNFFPATQPQFLMDINFEFGNNGPRFADGTVWRTNNMVARFTRDVTAQGGEYTFLTISDDGVRMKYTPSTPTGSGNCVGWNIICNWSSHGRTVDLRTITFPSAGNYRLTVEWYETTNEAIIVVSTGSNNFSFGDSPRTSPTSPMVPSTTYSDSSLVLDGVIDMCGALGPVLQFYTVYDTSDTMTVEITTNGGLDWTRGNFNGPPGGHDGNRPAPVTFTPPVGAISGFNNSQWSGTSPSFPTLWEQRRYNLWAYINRYMGMRFRLTTDGSVNDGWFVTDIEVGYSQLRSRASMGAACP